MDMTVYRARQKHSYANQDQGDAVIHLGLTALAFMSRAIIRFSNLHRDKRLTQWLLWTIVALFIRTRQPELMSIVPRLPFTQLETHLTTLHVYAEPPALSCPYSSAIEGQCYSTLRWNIAGPTCLALVSLHCALFIISRVFNVTNAFQGLSMISGNG